MTDRRDYGEQPQQRYGQQHSGGQPWQAEQDNPTARLPRVDAPQPPYPPPPGWAPQPGYGQPPGGTPGGPERRKPWAARHKVLTGFLAFCALVVVIGAAAAAGSSSSSTPVAATSSPTPKVPVAKARSTARQTPTAAQTATTAAAPSTPAQTTPAAQPVAPTAPPRTTPAAQPVAPTAPPRTTPAPPPSSKAPASCYPLSNEGTCYEPGEYCRDGDHGTSGVAGDGETIICEDNDGWRWEPA